MSPHSVSRDSHEPVALNTEPDFRCFFDRVMIPSLLPTGPDAQHMLGPSPKSVVIVIVMDLAGTGERATWRSVGQHRSVARRDPDEILADVVKGN